MTESVSIDGRGNSIQEAIREMWSRMQPLEQRGFHPISSVEIVEETSKNIVQTFQVTDPEFKAHLKSDAQSATGAPLKERSHTPERKEHYAYLARIRLEA